MDFIRDKVGRAFHGGSNKLGNGVKRHGQVNPSARVAHAAPAAA